MDWDVGLISGPDGEDWRVPASELLERQRRLSEYLANNGIESALIDDPVELYWLTGGRQNGMLLIGAEESGVDTTHWVRRSLQRAKFESGGTDSPHHTYSQPRMGQLGSSLQNCGCTVKPAMLSGKIPMERFSFINSKMSSIPGEIRNCTEILYRLREVKSDWEIQMHKESGEINKKMFEAVQEFGEIGRTELEIASVADRVSRELGFGGRIRMRKWPMDCDRVVIASGPSGSVPSYFDSAIGGLGASPISSLGAGFRKVKKGEPVLVDIVHLHRGYVSDCTRMFSAGSMRGEWLSRLEDMTEIRDAVVSSLGRGDDCSQSWEIGRLISEEMGHSEHLMGMAPDQSNFLGHSVGLELDETPVVARGFDRPLPVHGTMAVEPKVIHYDGSIGNEDTWYRTSDGMECLTAGSSFPIHTEW
ncbi:MAG: M24 family metallopeptidase [Candidatus Thalassarchaeaceae archaeon]|nr:M24 family metallopeptidase [Candidatus Thalassarchaeaceae archaeon]